MNSPISTSPLTRKIAGLATSALLLAGCDSTTNQCDTAEKTSALSQVSHDVTQAAKTVLYPIRDIVKNPATRRVSGDFQLAANGSMISLGHLDALQLDDTIVECHTYGPFDSTVECQAGNVNDTGASPITLTNYVQATASTTQVSVEEPQYTHGFPFIVTDNKGACDANNSEQPGAILTNCGADIAQERAVCSDNFNQVQLLLHDVRSSFAARIAP